MSGDDGRSPDADRTDVARNVTPEEDGGTDTAAKGSSAAPAPTTGTTADATRRKGGDGRLDGAAGEVWAVVREILISVAIVAAVGLVLFAVSGVWPPMVAVESGSMEPHMYRGDLVVISEPGRYVPDAAYDGSGVVTLDRGEEVGYRTFGDYGSVVVYLPDGRTAGSPVIHRTHFFVAAGENWYDEADPDYHHATSCADLPNCPAPNAGFITKGDNNANYDQVLGISGPVQPDWIVGVAHVRIPYLGHVRLLLSGVTPPPATVGGPAGDASAPSAVASPDRPVDPALATEPNASAAVA
jgi:signal peptidase